MISLIHRLKSRNLLGCEATAPPRFQEAIEFLSECPLYPLRYRSGELHKLSLLEMCNNACTASVRRIVEQEKIIGHFPYFRQLLQPKGAIGSDFGTFDLESVRAWPKTVEI